MKSFENGVLFYTTGSAVIKIAFPEDEVKCQWCPFCRSEGDLKRYWCRLTNNMLYYPYADGLPDTCPIILDEKE